MSYETLTIEQYSEILKQWQIRSRIYLPLQYQVEVSEVWFDKVAPIKTEQYGIECWQRLGAKGLIADISACHYRWKNMLYNKQNFNHDVLVDSFGYSVMYNVVLGSDQDKFPWVIVSQYTSPEEDNEMIIHLAWERDSYYFTGERAMRMAYNQWRRLNAISA